MQNISHQIQKNFKNFNDDAGVWVFSSQQAISNENQDKIIQLFHKFRQEWYSHSTKVSSEILIVFNHFILIGAEEEAGNNSISGCSKDSLFAFINHLEKVFQLSLIQKNQLAFLKNDSIVWCDIADIKECVEKKKISLQDIFFNNSICTIQQLHQEWIVELNQSWLKNRIA